MSFLSALQQAKQGERNIVIPDLKCKSPKEGDLFGGRDPILLAETLIQSGAPVLSVVTEGKEFGGSKGLLQRVASLGVPVLRKDFLQTAEDLAETRSLGASAVLLMYSCLGAERLAVLYKEARRIGLDVLVEVHTAEELEQAASLGARIIGINNRDILRLECDDGTVSLTKALAIKKPHGTFLISESSLQSAEDVRAAIKAGADAALIGTAILQAEDTARFYQKLCRKTRVKFCGMTSKENIRTCSQADILGFVVDYPENVPWNLSAGQAGKLLPTVSKDCQTCIVTGGSPEKVLYIARQLRPDFIQLHHNETLDQTFEIAQGLLRMGIRLIRSIPVSEQMRIKQFGIADLGDLAQAFAQAGVSELLFDGRDPENAANSDIHVPIEQFQYLKEHSPIPVMLAGRITPPNLKPTLEESGAEAIDIMTGIEVSPGQKSSNAVCQILRQLGG